MVNLQQLKQEAREEYRRFKEFQESIGGGATVEEWLDTLIDKVWNAAKNDALSLEKRLGHFPPKDNFLHGV
jgi:ATP-dependent Lon protease